MKNFILRHRGVQLILAYCWARPAILVAGESRGGCFYFFCFFTFIPVPLSSLSLPFISSTISSISFLPFSGRRHKMTHKGWHVIIPNSINQSMKNNSQLKNAPLDITTCSVKNIILTLILLFTTTPTFANSVDPDQMASEEAIWSGSTLFVILFVILNENILWHNLIGW